MDKRAVWRCQGEWRATPSHQMCTAPFCISRWFYRMPNGIEFTPNHVPPTSQTIHNNIRARSTSFASLCAVARKFLAILGSISWRWVSCFHFIVRPLSHFAGENKRNRMSIIIQSGPQDGLGTHIIIIRWRCAEIFISIHVKCTNETRERNND